METTQQTAARHQREAHQQDCIELYVANYKELYDLTFKAGLLIQRNQAWHPDSTKGRHYIRRAVNKAIRAARDRGEDIFQPHVTDFVRGAAIDSILTSVKAEAKLGNYA